MLYLPCITDNQHTALNQNNSKRSSLDIYVITVGIPTLFNRQGIIILQSSVYILLLDSLHLHKMLIMRKNG